MTTPSKEMLSVILNLDVMTVKRVAQTAILRYTFDESCGNKVPRDSSINIYELMHLMKEWALLHSAGITTRAKADLLNFYAKDYFWQAQIGMGQKFMSDTEFEAVTKACEQILKELK